MLRRVVAAAVGAVLALSAAAVAQAQPATVDQGAGGKPSAQTTYGELSARWFQWAYSIPVHTGTVVTHPLTVPNAGQPDTAQCGLGQSGPVWFLGGAFALTGQTVDFGTISRACTVPRGRFLFYPVLNSSCTTVEIGSGCPRGVGPQRKLIKRFTDEVDLKTLESTVDGHPVPPVRVNVQKPPWRFTQPEDNLLASIGVANSHAGTFRGVDDGYYVLVPPLPPGPHTIVFGGTITDPDFTFTLHVTYTITVA